MDFIKTPYISYMKDAAGNLYRGGWVKTDGPPLPFVHAWSSSRYDPDEDAAIIDIGEQRTEYVYAGGIPPLPARVCRSCYIGDLDWIESGDFPSDAPPVVLAADGWPTQCEDGKMGVQSIGLAVDYGYTISGSPVTSRGIISLDRITVPSGYVYIGPTTGADAKPTFKPLIVLAFVESTPLTLSILAASGIGYTTTIGSAIVTLVNAADAQHFAAGWPVVLPAGFSGPDHVVTAVDFVGGTITVEEDATSTNSNNLTVTPIGYAWQEYTPDPDTGAYFPKPGGLSGDATSNPAMLYDANAVAPNLRADVYWLRLRTAETVTPVWEFDGQFQLNLPSPVVVDGDSPISVAFDGINTYTVSLDSGDLPAGVTLPAPQVTSGTLPSGVLLPAAQLSAGTLGSGVLLPAAQLSTGTLGSGVLLPAAQLSAGTLGSGVLLPAAQLSAGTLGGSVVVPEANVTSGYPYSSLSGAPSPGAPFVSGDQTIAVVTTGTTVLTLTAPKAIIGLFEVTVLTAGTCTMHLTAVDPETGSHTGTIGIGGAGSWSGLFDCGQQVENTMTGSRPPYTSITVSITTTSNGNVRVRWGALQL